MDWTIGLSPLMGGTETYSAAHLSAGRPRLGSYWSMRPLCGARPARQKSLPVCLGTLGRGTERCWAGPAACRVPWSSPSESGWWGRWPRRSWLGAQRSLCNHNMISCAEQ